MKAYMVRTAKTIEPFDEHPRDQLILNRTLPWWQERTLRHLRLERVEVSELAEIDDPAEHLVFEDRLFFTPELLREFIGRSRSAGMPTVCALRRGVTTRQAYTPTQGVRVLDDRVEYELRYVPARPSRGASQVVVIDPDRNVHSIPIAEWLAGGPSKIALTSSLLVRIDHWTNVLSANLLSISAEADRLMSMARSPRVIKLAPMFLKALIRARSFERHRIAGKLNIVGKNCDIHPSAVVEASVIGDDVTIGPGSIVRASFLGRGCNITGTVQYSVLGANVFIFEGKTLSAVLYPGAIASSICSFCVCGRNTRIAGNSSLTDNRIDGRPVAVMKDGNLIDTEQPMLGSCLGHGAQVGAETLVAPGTSIPNGWCILPDKERVVRRASPDLEIPGYRVVRMPRP